MKITPTRHMLQNRLQIEVQLKWVLHICSYLAAGELQL